MRRALVRMAVVGGVLVAGLLPTSTATAYEEECEEVLNGVNVGIGTFEDFDVCDQLS